MYALVRDFDDVFLVTIIAIKNDVAFFRLAADNHLDKHVGRNFLTLVN